MWGKGICLEALRGHHGPLPFTDVVKKIISDCSVPLPHPTPREAIAFLAVITPPPPFSPLLLCVLVQVCGCCFHLRDSHTVLPFVVVSDRVRVGRIRVDPSGF